MACILGEPLWMDAHTSTWEKSSFARICVRLDLSRPLRPGIWIQGLYGRFFQPLEYEGLSTLCFRCGLVDHQSAACPAASTIPASSTFPAPAPVCTGEPVSVPSSSHPPMVTGVALAGPSVVPSLLASRPIQPGAVAHPNPGADPSSSRQGGPLSLPSCGEVPRRLLSGASPPPPLGAPPSTELGAWNLVRRKRAKKVSLRPSRPLRVGQVSSSPPFAGSAQHPASPVMDAPSAAPAKSAAPGPSGGPRKRKLSRGRDSSGDSVPSGV
ncbi:hypothetical protein MA16_Dca009433 [Dendrobium catenatum]|uniref:CCHC-type domain-containing protein n=1 Tax=Dendrobium catenatum TaxID=906689 RepID=A0A2I0XH96_9ASPA|nr:hypothetical protein MA16_Dca009433 [Dendrobium catenatum]